MSIRASDQSLNSNVKSSIALVNLRVNDINNHRPEINVNFFVIPGYIEPRLLTRKEISTDTIVKEEVVYLAKAVPANTTIGIVYINDKDSDWNGFIDGCQVYLLNQDISHLTRIPVYLEDYFQLIDNLKQNSSLLHFSSDLGLNNEIEVLIENEFKNSKQYKKSTNEKKYFIRTAFDLRALFKNFTKSSISYKIEFKSSDKGLTTKLDGLKQIKMFVINTNPNNIKVYNQILDEDEIDLDDDLYSIFDNNEFEDFDNLDEYDDNQYLSGRSTYKVDITENNDYPIELAKINSTDLELNSAVRFELLLPLRP